MIDLLGVVLFYGFMYVMLRVLLDPPTIRVDDDDY